MIRVGYIAGEPSPWRLPQLELIAREPGIDLTEIYAAATVQRREWKLRLPPSAIVLNGPSLPLTRILHHDFPLTPQIWPLLERERFDVLVVAGWSLLATQLSIVWARLRKVPYLILADNHLGESRPLAVRAVKSLVLRHVIPPAAGQLVPGALSRAHALHYGARPDTITIFPNTIDVTRYRDSAARFRLRRSEIRRSLGIAHDAVAVAYVGRLLPGKGVRDVVQAVARVRTLVARPFHLLIVGDGPLRVELQQRSDELGLAITFAGFREDDGLLECYAAADVLALFSYRETWGVVVNEAAASGLPLVLSDAVGAAADLLRPGENGELVAVGDLDGQARALARLADDGLRERYGRRSLELIEPWGYESGVKAFLEAVRAAARAAGHTDSEYPTRTIPPGVGAGDFQTNGGPDARREA